MMMADPDAPAYRLTPEQKYEFDLRGYLVLRQHFDADAVAGFHAGIDELQAIPIDYRTYARLGVASYFLRPAMADPEHPFWKGEHRPDRAPDPANGGVGRVDHALCGTDKFDRIVRDPVLKAIHTELAGGPVYLSATYYIEKAGPAPGGRLHNGGFPVDRDIHYGYDHTRGRFACKSTKSVIILSDMTRVENGPVRRRPRQPQGQLPLPLRHGRRQPQPDGRAGAGRAGRRGDLLRGHDPQRLSGDRPLDPALRVLQLHAGDRA